MPFAFNGDARLYYRVDGRADAPPLLTVSSLGSDHSMWDPVLPALTRRFRVIRMDKRGHGASDVTGGDYSMDLLGADALAVADAAGAEQFGYLGLSIGGMIGMWLGAHAPARVRRLVLANTAAQADPARFEERITQVMLGGMKSVADAVLGRFFTAGYAARRTVHYETVRQTLLAIDPVGYAGCCAAIRDMDLVPLLTRIQAPVLVIGGSIDQSTPAEQGRRIAQMVSDGRFVELPTAHFGHSEQPGRFVDLSVTFLTGGDVKHGQVDRALAPAQGRELGLARRKEVLGAGYVEQRIADTQPFTEGFQDLVTRYAWGEIWSRPVFDDRDRRLLVLALLIGLGRWEEFRLQVDKGLQAELDVKELEELLLLATVYAGVPAGNTGFHHALAVLDGHR